MPLSPPDFHKNIKKYQKPIRCVIQFVIIRHSLWKRACKNRMRLPPSPCGASLFPFSLSRAQYYTPTSTQPNKMRRSWSFARSGGKMQMNRAEPRVRVQLLHARTHKHTRVLAYACHMGMRRCARALGLFSEFRFAGRRVTQ